MAGGALVGAILLLGGPAWAHTDFLGSDPADDQALSEPVTEITLRFSETVSPDLSEGRLLDGNGRRITTSVFQRSPDELIVQPVEALTNGVFALVWETTSEDGHRVEGTLRFTVAEPAAAAADGTTTTTAPPEDPVPAAQSPPTTFTPTRPPAAAEPATAAVDAIVSPEPTAHRLAGILESLGRWLSLLGALLAIGAAAFAAFALVGDGAEIRRAVGWIRTAGILVVAGTLTQVLMLAVGTDGWGVLADPIAVIGAVPTGLAAAAVLRIVGGVALLQSPVFVTVTADQPRTADAGAGGPGAVTTLEPAVDHSRRLALREEWLILAGTVAIAASYLLDGHSATLGVVPRIANLVHVVAGGIWFGGIVVLADIAVRRRRAGHPGRIAVMAVRFSRVATAALVGVALAGSLLAWSIVDEPSDLVSGTWGRLLIGKVAFVAIAACIGAYNHVRVVPRLADDPASDQSPILARTLTAEALALIVAIAITAALVVSAP